MLNLTEESPVRYVLICIYFLNLQPLIYMFDRGRDKISGVACEKIYVMGEREKALIYGIYLKERTINLITDLYRLL